MVTTGLVRDRTPITEEAATEIAGLWNDAYPVMRKIATGYVDSMRDYVDREGWVIDPDHPRADVLQAYAVPEGKARRKLRYGEELRRELGQLDRGTHRPCTRSPGCFSVTAAYSRVRGLLGISSLSTPGMGSVYRLAAALADAEEIINEERAKWHAEQEKK
ncbi:hypothetical protein SEA_SATIS_271 [Streptomyces phage Satis]|nr:hypothetical protein SEA_SATIS_271 [Streptomyces phage Satis]QBZ72157.1 hypothetical protein SEA_KRADAL_271 [Streptomyces phage Kradal]QPL14579.1 hypothetical protein SEA_EHYELIMAYOE_274 [Streptomyces phage EhyElimayoE]